MACVILVSNQSSIERGEIVELCEIDRAFSATESMQVFLDRGCLFEDFQRKFSIVIIIDKTKKELSYLNDCKESEPYVKKWLFTEPARDTGEWQDLYLTGQVVREWAIVSQYIIEKI